MLFLDLLFVALLFGLTGPLITGYLGAANGRSFWRWYALGWVLPFGSLFVVMAVAYFDQRREERSLAEEQETPPLPPGA